MNIMKEKDIRLLMQKNRIPVPKDDRFMKDLIRQMDLLPTPAAFGSEEDARIQENIRLVRMIRQALKKHCRRQFVETVVLNILLCAVLALAAFLSVNVASGSDSPALQFILEWRYLLVGLLCTGSLLISLSRTDLFRI